MLGNPRKKPMAAASFTSPNPMPRPCVAAYRLKNKRKETKPTKKCCGILFGADKINKNMVEKMIETIK